jgi:hypothetical protein
MVVAPQIFDVFRTRISCHAALERTACAPFHEERRMKLTDAAKLHRNSGGGPEAKVSPARQGWVSISAMKSAVGAALCLPGSCHLRLPRPRKLSMH